MSEFIRSKEVKRVTGLFAVLATGSIALTACNGVNVSAMSPAERYDKDYSADYECLDNTPFDVSPIIDSSVKGSDSRQDPQASVSYDSESDLITVVAANGQELQLEGYTQTEYTMSPVDQATEDVFAAYGCEIEKYYDTRDGGSVHYPEVDSNDKSGTLLEEITDILG